jgi:hypothetical protein
LICRPLDRLAQTSFQLERPLDEVAIVARDGSQT